MKTESILLMLAAAAGVYFLLNHKWNSATAAQAAPASPQVMNYDGASLGPDYLLKLAAFIQNG